MKRILLVVSLAVAMFAAGAVDGVEVEALSIDTAMACGGSVSCCDSEPAVEDAVSSIDAAAACGGWNMHEWWSTEGGYWHQTGEFCLFPGQMIDFGPFIWMCI